MDPLKLKGLNIQPRSTVKNALKQLDESALRILFVTEGDGLLVGSLSDGDLRRALLSGVRLEDSIESVYNRRPISLPKDSYTAEEPRRIFLKLNAQLIPVIDAGGRIIDCISWTDVFGGTTEEADVTPSIDLPVVIMAGGRGSRLEPFTTVLPKPLIPVGEKTILERIADNFVRYGVRRFYFILNYRGEMIRAYFDSIARQYDVEYVWEDMFLGTAGGLRLVEDRIAPTFIVSNCDIIVQADYADMVRFHREESADLTIVSSYQHITVPYGVVEFSAGGRVTSVVEKPEFTYPINTGMYIVERSALSHIPPLKEFHMTQLVEALIRADRRVLTYPVNEKQYVDIGQWEQYHKSVSFLKG